MAIEPPSLPTELVLPPVMPPEVAAPVLDVQQALNNPFLAESKRIIDFQHPEHGPLPGIASSIRAGGVEHPDKAAPTLGADTSAILATLGYTDDDVAALRTRGAVR